MPVQRDNPYGAFNFRVDLGNGDTESIVAGFQEVSGLNTEVPVQEYRNGNEKVNHTRKLSGLYKVGDVTLKRGMVGAANLYEWIVATRNGDQSAPRTVTILLMDETGANAVATWRLSRARPMRWTAPTFNAKTSSDVAIEELVLACEDMTME